MTAREAIDFSQEVVMSKIIYHEVDEDEFTQKHGEYLHHSCYFELGLGDCDKYSGIFMGVFDVVKEINPNLENIYASDEYVGGNVFDHSWSSLVILQEDKMSITHFDLTFKDNKGKLEAKRGYHLTKDDQLFTAIIYRKLFEYEKSYQLYLPVFEKTTDEKIRADLLEDLAFLAKQMKDFEKMNYVRDEFYQLDVKKHSYFHECIIYYSYQLANDLELEQEKEFFKQELKENFPDSSWVEHIAYLESLK